jgi:ubiquinone/menaquinone biosynthesis C-methylase UbiE
VLTQRGLQFVERRKSCYSSGMNLPSDAKHQERVLQEFNDRAEAFATAPAITDPEALKLLLEMSGANPRDTVLDVACGAGVVLCAFARVVRHATGIDITPAMIQRAQSLQQEDRLINISWNTGDSRRLPYADDTFSIVLTRYSFHHMEQPAVTFSEMLRVCAPGGTLLVADVCASSEPAHAAIFNTMERLRDPSHVRALPKEELTALFQTVGLKDPRTASYSLEFSLRDLLQHSSASSRDLQRIREIVLHQLAAPQPAFPVHETNGEAILTYPILVLCATKPI